MDVGQGISSPTTGMTSPRSLQTPPNLDNMTLSSGGEGNPPSNGGVVSPKQHVAGLSQMGSPGSSLGRSSSVSPPGPALSLVTSKPYQPTSSQSNGGLPPNLPRSCGPSIMQQHHSVGHPQMGHPPLGYHRSLHPSSSPPGIAADMTTNDCRLIDYRGAKIAAFLVHGDYLLCLPQAFELFLKHLVGGLHTVYTKLKRLDITPIVCNVEQVRILRGLGAIQPGVNRCKLLSCKDFDALYKDCTTARRCFSAGRDLPHHELATTSSIYGPIDNSVKSCTILEKEHVALQQVRCVFGVSRFSNLVDSSIVFFSCMLRIRSFEIFTSRRFVYCFLLITKMRNQFPEPDEIGNLIEEVVNLARKINLEVDSDDVQELLGSNNQELTIDELIEMHDYGEGHSSGGVRGTRSRDDHDAGQWHSAIRRRIHLTAFAMKISHQRSTYSVESFRLKGNV
ncbi:dachshund homolog 1 [Trichonephila clavipes]|nr:dachshund homolog 1 [Trichonephila clavipes]